MINRISTFFKGKRYKTNNISFRFIAGNNVNVLREFINISSIDITVIALRLIDAGTISVAS